jgi:hypothetical protein
MTKDMQPQVHVEDMLTENYFGIRVRFRYLPHWTDVEVYEYVGQFVNDDKTDGAKFFNKKDAPSTPDPVLTLDEAEPYLTGYIKWDGCSEFDFGRPHWCGPDDYKKHFAILEAIYKRAQALMGSVEAPWN